MRKRSRAREIALQLSYELDLRGPEVLESLDALLQEAATDPEVVTFARELIVGCWEHRSAIDEKLTEAAKNWEIKRMAALDRNILRLAIYEILHRTDVPPLVAINEAIELAKRYSTKRSGPFVNGILDNIRIKYAPGNESRISNDESGKVN